MVGWHAGGGNYLSASIWSPWVEDPNDPNNRIPNPEPQPF